MGCIGQKPNVIVSKYKNDAITIENYYVTNINPNSGGIASIQFEVQNNLPPSSKPLPVEVYFFDLPGFTVNNLDCGTVPGDMPTDTINNKCIYPTFESSDSRTIILDLKAKDVEVPTPYTITFSVNYTIDGSRDALIPVVDGLTKKEPSFEFTQSTPTYGPILLDIQPQLEREKVVDNKIVTEYWGTVNSSFDNKFVFSHIGTENPIGNLEIPAGNVKFTLMGLNVSLGSCSDFNDNTHQSNRSVRLPYDTTLYCSFNPTIANMPEYAADIIVNFTYAYEYLHDQTFTIQPLPKP
jgi:hypothetical protein